MPSDAHDPFAHLRRPPTPSLKLAKPDPGEAAPPLDAREYRAFATHEKAARLDIRCARGPSHCPAYGYLLDIIYGRRFGTSFVLVYSFMTVTVTGRNLAPVVHAITQGSCAAITEYHAHDFDPPPPDAPLIERIETVTGEKLTDQADAIARTERR